MVLRPKTPAPRIRIGEDFEGGVRGLDIMGFCVCGVEGEERGREK